MIPVYKSIVLLFNAIINTYILLYSTALYWTILQNAKRCQDLKCSVCINAISILLKNRTFWMKCSKIIFTCYEMTNVSHLAMGQGNIVTGMFIPLNISDPQFCTLRLFWSHLQPFFLLATSSYVLLADGKWHFATLVACPKSTELFHYKNYSRNFSLLFAPMFTTTTNNCPQHSLMGWSLLMEKDGGGCLHFEISLKLTKFELLHQKY